MKCVTVFMALAKNASIDAATTFEKIRTIDMSH